MAEAGSEIRALWPAQRAGPVLWETTMKQIFVSALVAGSLIAPGAALSTSVSAHAMVATLTCNDDVPEAWKRPGGYCALIGGAGAGSIFGTTSGGEITVMPAVECAPIGYLDLGAGDRLHMAMPDPCDDPDDCTSIEFEVLFRADRIRMAC